MMNVMRLLVMAGCILLVVQCNSDSKKKGGGDNAERRFNDPNCVQGAQTTGGATWGGTTSAGTTTGYSTAGTTAGTTTTNSQFGQGATGNGWASSGGTSSGSTGSGTTTNSGGSGYNLLTQQGNVTFEQNIRPVFARSCAGSTCHKVSITGNGGQGRMDLSTEQGVRANYAQILSRINNNTMPPANSAQAGSFSREKSTFLTAFQTWNNSGTQTGGTTFGTTTVGTTTVGGTGTYGSTTTYNQNCQRQTY